MIASDDMEDDEFGEWARAAVVLRGTLADIAAPGEEAHFMAAPARGIRYRARAGVASLAYQSHPMRRDFLLTFELTRGGAASTFPGVPKVSGLWIFSGEPFQRFLYKEFVKAWKRAGR